MLVDALFASRIGTGKERGGERGGGEGRKKGGEERGGRVSDDYTKYNFLKTCIGCSYNVFRPKVKGEMDLAIDT